MAPSSLMRMEEATLRHLLWVHHYLGVEFGHDVLARYTADDLAELARRHPHVREVVEEPGRRVTLHPDGSRSHEERSLWFAPDEGGADDVIERLLRADEPPLVDDDDWPATAQRGEKVRTRKRKKEDEEDDLPRTPPRRCDGRRR